MRILGGLQEDNVSQLFGESIHPNTKCQMQI